MMFKQKFIIKDFSSYSYTTFDRELQSGLIIFFNSKGILNVFDTKTLEVLFTEKQEEIYNISFIDDCIFLSNGKIIFTLNLDNVCLDVFYKIESKSDSSLGILSKDLVIENKSKVVDFNIVEKYSKIINPKTSEILYSWEGLEYLIQKEGSSIYIKSIKGNNIIKKNIISNKIEYNINLDNGSFGQRIIGQTKDVFYIQRAVSKPNLFNVLALEKSTGKIIWETENTHPYYCFDEVKNKLYGLGDKHFEVINTLTGEKQLVTELDINVFISSHLTYYNDGLLYFSSHLDNNIPVFGAVDVKTGELDFIQEVKIEGEKSFRIGLEKPIVVDNRLYVKDSRNNLHIFEKEDNEIS